MDVSRKRTGLSSAARTVATARASSTSYPYSPGRLASGLVPQHRSGTRMPVRPRSRIVMCHRLSSGGRRRGAAAAFARPDRELDAIARADLRHDARDVGLHGAEGDVQLAADLGVAEPARDRGEHLLLAIGERRGRRRRRRGREPANASMRRTVIIRVDQGVAAGGRVHRLARAAPGRRSSAGIPGRPSAAPRTRTRRGRTS